MELTRYRGVAERGRYSLYEWEEKRVRVYDSALNSLRIIELFGDEELDPLTKASVLRRLMFVDAEAVQSNVTDLGGLISHLAWELCGLDVTGEHDVSNDGPQAFDWEKDQNVIRASLYMTYGQSFEELASEVTYRELTAMMGLIPHETPLGQAIYYRVAEPPELTQYNAEQVKAWKERADYWRLRDETETSADRMQAMNNRACDFFDALARRADG